MPNKLEFFEPTWMDKAFRKGLARLTEKQRENLEQELGDLFEALSSCRHPIQDPILQKFKPTPYRVSLRNPQGKLAEYRLTGKARVVLRYLVADNQAIDETFLLIAATVDHDHDRLVQLITGHKAEL